ncbi:MAG: glutathione S-transferase family protein [Proteobacteria bacterium]|nr:MAG: glutathione S-transferase family protein [Pseudomonadota bacterium]
MKLYDHPLSGNCYKVRLAASILNIDYETVPVDLMSGEQKGDDFRAINPLGQVPVLEDDGVVVRDSQAILVYLAGRFGGPDWLPGDPAGLAEVMQWLSFSAREMLEGPALARAIVLFRRPDDPAPVQKRARRAMAVLDQHLANHDWLALERPTIADLACYPYAALAHQGGVEMGEYGHLPGWFRRIQALPGWFAQKGIYEVAD